MSIYFFMVRFSPWGFYLTLVVAAGCFCLIVSPVNAEADGNFGRDVQLERLFPNPVRPFGLAKPDQAGAPAEGETASPGRPVKDDGDTVPEEPQNSEEPRENR